MIPLADPAREHDAAKADIEAAALRVLRGGHYILGPEVEAFEQAFAAYLGVPYVVGVSNGSDAIVVALQALGIGPGDEVITTALSYYATTSAILRAGAVPVFADIDPTTFNVDPARVAEKITARTRAILPVHLFGRAADVTSLLEIAAPRGIAVLEDNAQGCGATIGDRKTGTLGTAGTFSFFPAKPFGCAGDGGAVVTSDKALADRMRQVRITGAVAKNTHALQGGNYRLDPLQAAILGAKLGRLEDRLERRRIHASALRQGLAGIPGLVLPGDDDAGRHVYAQFTVRHARRDELQQRLKAAGIASEVYYPVPMCHQVATGPYRTPEGSHPHAERASREVLSIPTHSELTDVQLASVLREVRTAALSMEGL